MRSVPTARSAAAGIAVAVRRHWRVDGELLCQQEGGRLLLAQHGRGGLPRHMRLVRALHSSDAADVATTAAVAASPSSASAPAVVAAVVPATLPGHRRRLRQGLKLLHHQGVQGLLRPRHRGEAVSADLWDLLTVQCAQSFGDACGVAVDHEGCAMMRVYLRVRGRSRARQGIGVTATSRGTCTLTSFYRFVSLL